MKEIRSKVLKIRNLPKNSERVDFISSKPYMFLTSFLAIGILMFLIQLKFIGVVLTGLSAVGFFVMKDKVVTEFYDEYVVFYDEKKPDECYILFWEDIVVWHYLASKSSLDEIDIVLKNDKHVKFQVLSKTKILKYFRKYAHNSEEAKTNELIKVK